MKYIVELEPGVWLASWSGDPGRTTIKSSARRYRSLPGATFAIERARRYSAFWQARIVEVES